MDIPQKPEQCELCKSTQFHLSEGSDREVGAFSRSIEGVFATIPDSVKFWVCTPGNHRQFTPEVVTQLRLAEDVHLEKCKQARIATGFREPTVIVDNPKMTTVRYEELKRHLIEKCQLELNEIDELLAANLDEDRLKELLTYTLLNLERLRKEWLPGKQIKAEAL